MKTTVRRLKLTHYELRVLIEVLNAKRLKQLKPTLLTQSSVISVLKLCGKP